MTRAWFHRNVEKGLQDHAVRAAVSSTAARKIKARAEAVGEIERFDELRDLVASVKQHTLDHLDHYIEEFTTNVEKRGGVVHRAATGADAVECIKQIAKSNGLSTCVKVKSMATEEIGLTAALEDAGVETFETDLGEFIVQIDDDRPSHIVTPIIHKNRKSVARAMTRELGVEYSEDPETLTMYARKHLRDVFQRCDLGISGANFAVAESGTVCICTNEGNGRFTTSQPKVHVALVGIEKIIPRVADLSVFLKVLARSSTGQPITVYTSMITGPRRVSDEDGPEQFHVVLLDNGRSAIHDSEFRESLRCIRCGACLNACPVFRRIGGHAYGSTYPGPIGKVITPLLCGLDHYSDLPQASSLCGFCRDVCPVKIDIPELLVKLRRDQVVMGKTGTAHRLGFRTACWMLSSPFRYRLGQRLARIAGSVVSRRGWMRRLPWPISRWTQHRDLPCPAPKSFRELWKGENSEAEHADGEKGA